jgi:hypothetical protein
MKKTDIAKLVADALEAEFGSYRNAELQHITAWNDGQHGDSQAVCLLLTKKGESLKAFKDREFSWMRHLFGQRLDLDYSAGLLLGFSRGMTEDAIFVDANKSNLKLPLSLRKRPISAVLVKAFTDRKDAIANSDINKPHVTTYDVGELIAWAKEKGFVADEVLAAWEAYNKPEAEQVTVTATSDAVEAGHVTATAKAESKRGDAWKAEALEKAKNIIARQGEKGLHPNLLTIADEIANDWRSQGKHGPKGTPLTGAYIKRHALQGTGIAIDRSSIISA